ncbi:MAG TPA: hypothetical protein VGD81_11045 [Opitutaceae bacterium]
MTPHALTLRQLLEIRQRNTRPLRKIPGYLGSAIGHKYTDGKPVLDREGRTIPAILVFVEKKKNVPPAQRVPVSLEGAKGLSCPTDVVEGTLPADAPTPQPVDGDGATLWHALRNPPLKITGGIPLTSEIATGTAACLVRSTAAADRGRLGVLTNWHVAGLPGNRLLQPSPHLRPIGVSSRVVFTAPKTSTPDDLESFTNAAHRLDAGFVALYDARPRTCEAGVHSLGPLGEPHTVNLDSPELDLVGRHVLGIGQTLGRQRGTIVAYGYEWKPDPDDNQIYATDYLIVGERDGQPFAAAGDSGKLVVTDDEKRTPVALLWGGQRQGFWNAQAQESWAYASAIRTVLDALEVAIEPNPRRHA